MVARSGIQFDGSFVVRVVSTNLAHIQAKFIVMELSEWKNQRNVRPLRGCVEKLSASFYWTEI